MRQMSFLQETVEYSPKEPLEPAFNWVVLVVGASPLESELKIILRREVLVGFETEADSEFVV
jgi:hypothetical protein